MIPGTNYYTQVTSTLWIAFTDGQYSMEAKGTGVPPTTAGLFQHGCKYIQTDSGTQPALWINMGTPASPSWLQTSGVANSSANGVAPMNVAHAVYNFATDGGAVSTITPALTAAIPAHAVIVIATVDVTTSCTSGGSATIAIGTSAGSSTTSILAATAVASMGAGITNGVPVIATPVKLTAAGNITVTIAVAALTAGVIEVFASYYVAQS